ncbi:hypothetical protein AKJ08_0233 [Vulgatibacter incomptus]|uniref:Uncharacterized protein n=1 Tax=Vulgatibacter incomptus TaxID=1391653 RepID=A0A0K1P8W0_9BACT|nr:hypothetical protein AKJ08_0233 [Vulgatibacter incomptus]
MHARGHPIRDCVGRFGARRSCGCSHGLGPPRSVAKVRGRRSLGDDLFGGRERCCGTRAEAAP